MLETDIHLDVMMQAVKNSLPQEMGAVPFYPAGEARHLFDEVFGRFACPLPPPPEVGCQVVACRLGVPRSFSEAL